MTDTDIQTRIVEARSRLITQDDPTPGLYFIASGEENDLSDHPGWEAVTKYTPAQLRPVWHAFRVVPASTHRAAFARSASVFLIDREGRERVIFQLEQLTPEALAHDVRKLLG